MMPLQVTLVYTRRLGVESQVASELGHEFIFLRL